MSTVYPHTGVPIEKGVTPKDDASNDTTVMASDYKIPCCRLLLGPLASSTFPLFYKLLVLRTEYIKLDVYSSPSPLF